MRQAKFVAPFFVFIAIAGLWPHGFIKAHAADVGSTPPSPDTPRAVEEVQAEYRQTYQPYSAAALRLAWLSSLKLRADQAFISAGNQDPNPALLAEAVSRYGLVEKNACNLPATIGSVVEANTTALLCEEAKYRSLLLKHGIGFWGLTRLRNPASPVVHLKRLRSLMTDMRRIHGAVLASTDEAENLDRQANTADIAAADVRVETERGNAQLKRLEIESRETRRDQRNYMLSIEGMRQEQRIQQQNFDVAHAQFQAAQSALNQAVLNGISQFSGVDLATLDSAVKGDLGPALLGAANIPEVKSAVGEWVKSNESLAAAFSEAEGFKKTLDDTVKKYNEVKGYVEKGREVIDAVRNPNIENLAKIGNVVLTEYCKQNAADCQVRQAKLRERVAAAKPFFNLLQKAAEEGEKGDFVRSRLNNYLIDQIGNSDAELQKFIGVAIDTHVADIKTYYRSVVTTIWEKSENAQFLSDTLADLLALKSRTFVVDARSILQRAGLATDQIDQLQDFLGVVCQKELERRAERLGNITAEERNDVLSACFGRAIDPLLATRSITVQTTIEDADTARRLVAVTLTYSEPGKTKTLQFRFNKPALDEFLRDIDRIVDARRTELIGRSKALLGRWTKVGAAARQRVVSILPLRAIDGFIEKTARAGTNGYTKVAGSPAAKSLFDLVMGDGSALAKLKPEEVQGEAQTEARLRYGILQDLANIEAGVSAAKEVTETQAKQAQALIPADAPTSPTVNGGSPELAYATMALNAAFPGAGVAVSVVQNLFASFSALDRMKEAGKKIQAAMEAESRFMDLVHKTEAAQEIVGVEAQLAQKILEVRDLQLGLYQANADLITQASAERRKRAQRRLPLFFYVTERMREEYDLLDLAIQRWGGFDVSPSGTLVDLIKSDPQNVRYATDSSIHLFTWFDRSDEGTRTDVDLTLVHWEQLIRLAEDSCKVVGCDVGVIETSEVRQSRPIDIREMMTTQDRGRFEEWRDCKNKTKSGPVCRTQPAVFAAGIRPTLSQVYANGNDYNLRIVAIRAGYGSDGDLGAFGERLNIAHGLTLRHPGVSVIYDRRGRRQSEYLLPRSAGGFDRAAPFDLAALSARWAEHELPVKRAFEGYGLLSDWLITLEGTSFTFASNQTVYLRFAYQAMRSDNAINEAQAIEAFSREAPALDPFEYLVTWTIRRNGLPERRVEQVVTLEELGFLGEIATKQKMRASGSSTSSEALTPAELRCERDGRLWVEDSASCVPLSWSNLATRFRSDELKNLTGRLGREQSSRARPSAVTVARRCKTEAAYIREYYEGLLSTYRTDRLMFQNFRPADWGARTALPLGLAADKAARAVRGSAQPDLWSIAQQEAPKAFGAVENGRCEPKKRGQQDVLVSFEGERLQ
ncbi:hypothetical protein LRP30_16130 [Bradyrhizobium sp. C-145]|uniref:hypothetical protein n=1 Tax=Bradyrhizobium sp. C-145 TaxID=574727 RepID=UPI00201B763D|nr:hypothetical protein [Bradyrhizobium sp. C-145]UQR66683.1 hypothetical protein LRP30_16130 [Bradyrhizobium sp. C-145]